ncbi:H(+)-transporting V0 sector ATPase subunit d [Clydaea vesicula]|uniref:H(+)-transporting V0 sector ATPase subunit d n=1 Tax=Clydaea vesicula TaxID=447962 RepID=A0AAD5Y1W1_9FUNG|nr:H(+)-transporting V0 sector ATPase subunit d [Clydaea vesicula]
MNGTYFNIETGYLEGIVRGYKAGILTAVNYQNLTQCETLDDLKLQLSATDYGNFLSNEPSPLATTTISEKMREKLVQEFQYLRVNSTEPTSIFLDYITYSYMIDNVILLITGTLHNRDTHELLERCHPLGMFDSIAALCVATSISELYNTVMIETPIAPYFEKCLSAHDLDEMNIEIIRNTLYKAYIEDFYNYCQSLGNPTAEVMGELLQFEADRRVINITINSFNTELTKDDRQKLFPTTGKLFPDGILRLGRADDVDQVKLAVDQYSVSFSIFEFPETKSKQEYKGFFDNFNSGTDKSLEDKFFEYEVFLNKRGFMQQFHYSVFYSYLKLKEQEIRNIVWIAEIENLKVTVENVEVTFDPSIIPKEKGTLYFTDEKLYWKSEVNILSIDFPTISIHAIDSGNNRVYCQLDVNPETWLTQESQEKSLGLEEDTPMVEMILTPANVSDVERIFIALSDGASLNPDPNQDDSDEFVYNADDLEEFSMAGQAAIEYLDSVFEARDDRSTELFQYKDNVERDAKRFKNVEEDSPQR